MYGESVLDEEEASLWKTTQTAHGAMYFEKQQYKNAQPSWKYVNSADKIGKEILAELSYCYYKRQHACQAIEVSNSWAMRLIRWANEQHVPRWSLQNRAKANARNAFNTAITTAMRHSKSASRFIVMPMLSYELGCQDVALNEMKNASAIIQFWIWYWKRKKYWWTCLPIPITQWWCAGFVRIIDKPTFHAKVYQDTLR